MSIVLRSSKRASTGSELAGLAAINEQDATALITLGDKFAG
jgi:hypothetical protein